MSTKTYCKLFVKRQTLKYNQFASIVFSYLKENKAQQVEIDLAKHLLHSYLDSRWYNSIGKKYKYSFILSQIIDFERILR